MAERDYKVVYKSRVLDRDEERPRIPTALDPYDTPYAAEPLSRRKYNLRGGSSNIDDTSTTEVARSNNRTTYSVREGDRAFAVMDQQRDNRPARRSESMADNRTSRDRAYIDVDVDRLRERGRDYYVEERPRQTDGPYVIDARDVIDITVPGRQPDRGYSRDVGRYRYEEPRSSGSTAYGRDYTRDQYSRSTGDVRGGNTIVASRDYRSKYDENDDRSSRARGGAQDYDREEDWRLVDSMRDTRIGSTRPPPQQDRQSRSRAQTYSSEDDYVIVSPSSRGPPPPSTGESSTRRSAIARTDYAEPELRRRRSRSISFRGSQVQYHDASERNHERPGAEAQLCGLYLGRPISDIDDRSSVAYSSYDRRGGNGDGRRSKAAETDRDRYTTVTYRERDEPYPPQSGFDSGPREGDRKRERSRRRRKDDDDRGADDDDTYYSENITKTTTRETRYR